MVTMVITLGTFTLSGKAGSLKLQFGRAAEAAL